mgnify:CR=1 FL=1
MVDQTVTGIEEEIGLAAIKVVGVGGGGSNAVSRMYRERIPEVEYITVNTDAQALSRSDVCLLYTSPSPRDGLLSRMPSSA